ncbi:MAG TPA: hypothetical protein VFT74_09125 [Isosphaeraceae bacterium]|nr:hypothetical protein [Isosphaeraceae bacterium]
MSITRARDTGRDVRKPGQYAELGAVVIYDDNRRDKAGQIARDLAGNACPRLR